MNRIEFMETLSRLLLDIPEEDRIDALKYYNDTCTQTITEEEFLPRPARGENLLLVQQPGFWDKKPPFFS